MALSFERPRLACHAHDVVGRRLRVLVIEDDDARVKRFNEWLPDDISLVHAKSGGRALGILERDKGTVYSALMLDHDLQQQPAADSDLEMSGTKLIQIICRNIDTIVPILVHSTNRTHGSMMVDSLAARGFAVEHIPMDLITQAAFLEWIEYVREVWED
jgi:CheY-like chemotaxis protein